MKSFIFLVLMIFTCTTESFSQVSNPDTLIAKNELKKIIVYGSDTCHYCVDTKTYLIERKIDFIYFDVDLNPLKEREMLVKLQKAKIPVDNIFLPVVDINSKLFMNNGDFDVFLKKLTIK